MISLIKKSIRVVIKPIWKWANSPFEIHDIKQRFDKMFQNGIPVGLMIDVSPDFESPEGTEYVPPDGRILQVDDYPELFSILLQNDEVFGDKLMSSNQTQFAIPNLMAKALPSQVGTIHPGGKFKPFIITLMRIK